ncbi:MAG TPA: histidine kinase [Acidimicrobiales bacterium]|nr:histidine kinase [Acidimicrobiales bacterium]
MDQPLPVPLTRRITGREWLAIDVVVAVLLLGSSVAAVATGHRGSDGSPGAGLDPLRYLAMGLACVPLPARRRRPWVVLACAVLGDAVLIGLGGRDPAHLAAGLAMYSAAAGAQARLPASAIGAAVSPLLLAAVVQGAGRTVQTLVFAPAVLVVGWLAGENTRARRSYAEGLAERAAEREREQARRAAADERARIARELHDVVAHTMSVVAVRSGVARAVMDSRPDEAAEALSIIETVSRRGLGELRRIVSVLRRADERGPAPPEDLAPAPGLRDLPSLVAEVGQAGVRVDLRVEGAERSLPPGQDLSAFRIAQEALTNVVRHAAPAAATLSVRYGLASVEIECVDDGGGRSRPPSSFDGGHGLPGMRERVALYGGDLSAGPWGAGFRVLARLPVTEETE